MKGEKQQRFFSRVIRFLFVGMWEAAYRRKRRRELFRPHTVSRPYTEQPYYRRYRWIKKKMD